LGEYIQKDSEETKNFFWECLLYQAYEAKQNCFFGLWVDEQSIQNIAIPNIFVPKG
jgi:hypothetical protein